MFLCLATSHPQCGKGLLIRFPVFSRSHSTAPSALLLGLFFLSAAVVRPLPYSELSLPLITFIIKCRFITQTMEAIHNMHSVLATSVVLCYTPHVACWLLHLGGLSPSVFLIWNLSFYSSRLMLVSPLQWWKCFSYCL